MRAPAFTVYLSEPAFTREAFRTPDDLSAFMENTERTLQGETGISSLKLRYTRVFGWYLEVTKTHLDKVPKDGTWVVRLVE